MTPCTLSAALRVAAVAVCSLAVVESAGAQARAGGATHDAGIILTTLSPPVYPPLARAARIVGDVVVKVSVRKDGSIESVELFAGHPMLASAALESAKHSTFVCRGCEVTTSYLLTYTFGISGDCHFGPNCDPLEPQALQVIQAQGKITLTAEPMCTCEPTVTIIRVCVRAPKCLYLWKCSFREAEGK